MNRLEFDHRSLTIADEATAATIRLAEKASKCSAPVFLIGESGTGKELIARYVHQRGPRRKGPFVSINCAAIPEGLLESELFGHNRGAFTGAVSNRMGKFEQAHRGTLLLDEISEMPLLLQAKLLRVLQEGEIDRLGGEGPIRIDTRVIATTNREPMNLVREGKFRQDLFYRLNVIRIECTPLRDRPEAILNLSAEFLGKIAYEQGEAPLKLTPAATRKLLEHRWPGNVRELKNSLERAAWLAEAEEIDACHLEFGESTFIESDGSTVGEQLPLAEIEKKHILSVLEGAGGNRTNAARILGISVRTLRNKLRLYREQC